MTHHYLSTLPQAPLLLTSSKEIFHYRSQCFLFLYIPVAVSVKHAGEGKVKTNQRNPDWTHFFYSNNNFDSTMYKGWICNLTNFYILEMAYLPLEAPVHIVWHKQQHAELLEGDLLHISLVSMAHLKPFK